MNALLCVTLVVLVVVLFAVGSALVDKNRMCQELSAHVRYLENQAKTPARNPDEQADTLAIQEYRDVAAHYREMVDALYDEGERIIARTSRQVQPEPPAEAPTP